MLIGDKYASISNYDIAHVNLALSLSCSSVYIIENLGTRPPIAIHVYGVRLPRCKLTLCLLCHAIKPEKFYQEMGHNSHTCYVCSTPRRVLILLSEGLL